MFDTGFLLSGLPIATLIGGFLGAGLIGKAIVLLQGIAALAAAGIAIGKSQEIHAFLHGSKCFLREFLTGRDVLDYYLLTQKDVQESPTSLELIYNRTCERMVKLLDPETRPAVTGKQVGTQSAALSAFEIELVRCTCSHTVQDEIFRVRRGLGTLAGLTLATPLMGVLGTVWGVADVLADMGSKEEATFVEIAPQLASALGPTVVGLLVATPCVLAYYHLSIKVRQLAVDMEGFADELMGRLACEFQGGSDSAGGARAPLPTRGMRSESA